MIKRILLATSLLVLLFTQGLTPTEDAFPNDDCEITIESHIMDAIGMPLSALKEKYPQAKIFIQPDAYPDAAAICFGEDDARIVYVLCGVQGNDFQIDVNSYGEQLICCGILTTTGVFFPKMPETISFSDFLMAIGVSEYSYTEEEGSIQGWLCFLYDHKTVWINANVRDSNGIWSLPEYDELTKTASIIITDDKIENDNYALMGW